jgi:hypothetical protein
MTTLGGDLIRLLAHAGLSTAGNVGTQLMANYLQPGMATKEAYGKGLVDVLGSGNEPDRRAAAEALQNYGIKVPMVNQTNPAGNEVTSSEGAKLTAPTTTPLGELASGMTPVTSPLRMAPTLDKLKASIIGRMPEDEQKIAVAPRDTALQQAFLLARMKESADKEKFAATLEDKQAARQQHNDLMLQLGTMHNATAMQNANTRQMMMKLIGSRYENQADQAVANSLEKSHEQYLTNLGPLGNEKSAIAAAEKFNSDLDRIAQKFPHIAGNYQRIPIEEYQKPTWGGLGTPETRKRIGTGVSPSTPTPKPNTSVPTKTPTITFDEKQAELRRRGLIP